MSLRVLQIGGDAQWVKVGKPPLRRFGVPEGGPFDRESWRWACHLVNSRHAIEIGPFGASLCCEGNVTVALVGAERRLRINEDPVRAGRHTLKAGDILELGTLSLGARSYLALSQGSGEGMLRRGDLILGTAGGAPTLLGGRPASLTQGSIAVLPGPEADLFDWDTLTETEWMVSVDSDRRGLRLSGPPLKMRAAMGERLSEPQPVGTIQVSLDGTPIVIGPDGPTIGGYPRVAVVIDAERDRLGQLVPGSLVRLYRVSRDEALERLHAYRARLLAIPL